MEYYLTLHNPLLSRTESIDSGKFNVVVDFDISGSLTTVGFSVDDMWLLLIKLCSTCLELLP